MRDSVKNLALIAALAAYINSCGNAKFAGGSANDAATDSATDSGLKSESTTEQPTEVAGGFGLTCIPSDHPSDDTKSDFSCRLADANG